MIKLLIGQPGEGKTKEMIAHANAALSDVKGNIVFIGESNESMLEIHHNIRFINISEYPVTSSTELLAFIHGLVSSNYDIERIFIDGVFNLFIMTQEEISTWLESAQRISDKFNIKFQISISLKDDIKPCLEKFVL